MKTAQTNYAMRSYKLTMATLALIIVFLITTIITTACAIARDNDEPVNEEFIGLSASISNDSELSPVTPIVEPKTAQSINPTLEEKYASVFEWQKWYDDQDFGVEQLYYLNECCERYDIPMEFMLSLIATESSFRSHAAASTSSATGYCQIIKSTAKWVYEDLLHRGTYDEENHRELMKNNWKLNMDLSTKLVDWLYNRYESWEMAAQRYYGSTDSYANEKYADRIDSHMTELFNMTIADLDNK